MSSTESQTAFIVSWMSSFYKLVRLVSGLQQIPLLVSCLICLGLRMAVKWGKAPVDKEVLPDSSGRTDTGDQNFNLISLPEIVLNQIYFFKYGYVCLCLIISYLPGSILSAHRNQCELWAQRDCPIITKNQPFSSWCPWATLWFWSYKDLLLHSWEKRRGNEGSKYQWWETIQQFCYSFLLQCRYKL